MTAPESYNRGVEAYKRHEYEEALQHFHKAVAADSEFFRAYTYMAMTHQKMSNNDSAIDCYLKAILIQPDYHKAYNNLGELYRMLGRLEDALAAFQSASKLEPTSTTYHYNMALTNRDLGNIDAAVQEFEKSYSLSPSDAEIVAELSGLLYDTDQYERAAQVLEEFLKDNQDHSRFMEFESRARAVRKKINKEGAV